MDDAWKRMDDLRRECTKTYTVRPDLLIKALACDRTVRFTLVKRDSDDKLYYRSPDGERHYYSTERNVGTMRELAHALLEACDFVEGLNPTWAEMAADRKKKGIL